MQDIHIVFCCCNAFAPNSDPQCYMLSGPGYSRPLVYIGEFCCAKVCSPDAYYAFLIHYRFCTCH